jgi:hypothetical protein
MKTSMAYRMFRLYFNSHSDNHEVFGNRVHNPSNTTTKNDVLSENIVAILRGLAVIIFGLALIAAIS